jgi:hypothetical protein
VKDTGQLGPQIQPVKPHPSKAQPTRIHASTSAVDTGEAFPYSDILVEEKPRRLEASQQSLVSNAFSSLPPDIGVPPVYRQCHHWKIARCVFQNIMVVLAIAAVHVVCLLCTVTCLSLLKKHAG